MTMTTQLTALTNRIATEFRTIRTLVSGSATGDVSALETSANNLVSALNEVRTLALSKASIDDSNVSAITTWSSNKTSSEIQAAVAALVNASPSTLDTLSEIATALGNDPNLATTLSAEIGTKANSSDVYTIAQVDAQNAVLTAAAAQRPGIQTFTSKNINVYADSSRPPLEDPNFVDGWYFVNAQAGQKFNWYPYSGAATTHARQDISSIYMVVRFYQTTCRPHIGIYSKPTGTGDASSWYHSRWVYATYDQAIPTAPGTYLVHFGDDPGIYPELPRLEIQATEEFNSVGDRALTEEILTYAWGTDSSQGVGQEELTVSEIGHKIANEWTSYALTHIGATSANLAAAQADIDSNTSAISTLAGTDLTALFQSAVTA